MPLKFVKKIKVAADKNGKKNGKRSITFRFLCPCFRVQCSFQS